MLKPRMSVANLSYGFKDSTRWHRHRMHPGGLLLVAAILSGCAASPKPEVVVESRIPRAGADRDAHGCIGSAGYRWCERLQQCQRPWELAAEKGLANDAETVAAYCQP